MSSDPAVAPDGSPVELYLRLSGERETGWIQPAIPTGSSVLDLGCGVGRIGVGLLAAGHRVTGVDDSPEMLAHAEARGIEPVLAGLIGLDLGRTFDVVLLLSHLVNEADPTVRAALWSAAADHVGPGGLVVGVTYRIDGRSYAESFDAVALDQSALADEAAQHGLRFVRWLDDAEELALLSAA